MRLMKYLVTTKRRATYDQYGHSAFENGGMGAGGFSGGFTGNFSDMGDIFGDIFGGGFSDIFGGGSSRDVEQCSTAGCRRKSKYYYFI